MKLQVHALRGCAPTPLAHYLKALGIFRLVADQKDPGVRAFWREDVFYLATVLSAEELLTFLCDEFAPTPLVSPWNGGSGFYPKDAKTGIDALAGSQAPRFAAYRAIIVTARAQVAGRDERPESDEKAALLSRCQREWPESALAWFAAAVSLSRDGSGRYPALLGTGGNDGRLDFTNNFMQRLVELVDVGSGRARAHAVPLARAAVFGSPELGLDRGVAIGQFQPGSAGGANGTAGFDAESLINPWDFVLMLEGAVLLRTASLRRLDGGELAQAAAPFAVRGLPGGYASAGAEDDGGRGEQWLPLWPAPVRAAELRAVFAEARVVHGSSRAEGALDAARAVAQLGSARGIGAFVRFGFMERNGQSNLAVPLDRVVAHATPAPDIRLLDELDRWLDALRWASRDKHAAASVGRTVRGLDAAAFDLCAARGSSPRAWCAFLAKLGAAEDTFTRSPRFTVERHLQPLPLLSRRWLDACNDGSVEYRLARALASTHAPHRNGKRDELGPIRTHCLPLDPTSGFKRFAASAESLRKDPRVVWTGGDLPRDLAAIVLRRIKEGGRDSFDGIPLEGATFVSLDDITQFVNGAVDDARIGSLSRGLMAVTPGPMAIVEEPRCLPLYALFRAANLDASERTRRALPSGVKARSDAQAVRLLIAARIEEAARTALARLGAMGFRPKLRHVCGDSRLALRLAASLAFPISPAAVGRVLDACVRPFAAQTTENA